MKRSLKGLLCAVLILMLALCAGAALAEAAPEAAEAAATVNRFYQTFWSLLPPVIAIALALITKEVYSSLFIGIVVGGLLYSNFNFEGTLTHVFNDGVVAVLSDPYNVGILVFLVILGVMVVLMNKAGGSAAFGRWAAEHIKTRAGAQLATVALGVLIFIDDYFNCLTVGSVMRPVADKHKTSRAKLAYLIDATAAPICIIAPVSKQLYGSGVAQRVRALRIEKARRLLAERPELSVGDVAEACGFSDYNYFISVFTRLTKESPSRYRRRAASAPTDG